MEICGMCKESGIRLISCETCPVSYHSTCLGYDKAPRGKWKCYFCKIVKYGIQGNISKIAPNEVEVGQQLLGKFDDWKDRAIGLIRTL